MALKYPKGFVRSFHCRYKISTLETIDLLNNWFLYLVDSNEISLTTSASLSTNCTSRILTPIYSKVIFFFYFDRSTQQFLGRRTNENYAARTLLLGWTPFYIIFVVVCLNIKDINGLLITLVFQKQSKFNYLLLMDIHRRGFSQRLNKTPLAVSRSVLCACRLSWLFIFLYTHLYE